MILPRFDYDIIIVFFSLSIVIFRIILAKKKDIKLKYRKNPVFLLFYVNIFELDKCLVPTPNTMRGFPCDDIALEKFLI